MREKLAMMRERENMTQTELSRYARISQGYYSEIESGFRCPSPNVACRIAKALNIDDRDMFRVFYAEGQ